MLALKSVITQYLSIHKIFVGLLLPWLIVIPLLAVLFYQYLSVHALAPFHQRLEAVSAESGKAMAQMLGDLKRDALFLAYHRDMQRAAANGDSASLVQAQALLQAFSEASEQYDQIRWIDESGLERVRVNRVASGVEVVPLDQLQSKSQRYYVKEGLALSVGEFYFSKLDLNIEKGVIEQPLKPILRIATPIDSGGSSVQGLVVLNFAANPLLEELQNIGTRVNVAISLLNQEGYWLSHKDPSWNWGFMFGEEQNRLAVSDPVLWQQISASDTGQVRNKQGLWRYQTVKVTSDNKVVRAWKLVVNIPSAQLKSELRRAFYFTAFFAAGLFIAAVLICLKISVSIFQRDRANQQLDIRRVELEALNMALRDSLETIKNTQAQLVETGKLSSLGLMVAGIAHELNTPLGAALVAISTVQTEGELLEQAFKNGLRQSDMTHFFARFTEGASIILRNLDRSVKLVQTFKRLAVDRTVEERRRFTLVELVEDLSYTTWLKIENQLLHWDVDIDERMQFNSYPGALGQVLENLVANALVHAFDQNSPGDVRIFARPDDNLHSAIITVSDNGKGITESDMPLIFDPFFTTRRGQGGTGLGLHLVHQLVTQLLSGTITVDSVLGQGTCFTVVIPFDPGDQEVP